MIKLENVSKFYNTDDKIIVGIKEVSLELNDTGLVLLSGLSGSGKSTLLNVISRNLVPDIGSVKYSDNLVTSIGYQDYNLVSEYTVYENIMLTCLAFYGLEESTRKVNDIISLLGLAQFKNQPVKYLSGGQKARVSFGRAIVANADVYIFDEPTANLDQDNVDYIRHVISELSNEKLVIIAAHDLNNYTSIANRIITLKEGLLVSDETITSTNELIIAPKGKKNDETSFILKTDLKRLRLTNIRDFFLMFVSAAILFITLFCADSITKSIVFDKKTTFNTSVFNMDDNRTLLYNSNKELSKDKLDGLGYEYEINPFYCTKRHLFTSTKKSPLIASYESKPSYKKLSSGEMPQNDDEALLLVNKHYLEDYLNYVGHSFYYVSDYENFGTFKISGIAVDDNLKEVCFSNNKKIKNVIQNECLYFYVNGEASSAYYSNETKVVSNSSNDLSVSVRTRKAYYDINVEIPHENANIDKPQIYINPLEEIKMTQIYEALFFKSPDHFVGRIDYKMVNYQYNSDDIITINSAKELLKWRIIYAVSGFIICSVILYVAGEVEFHHFKQNKSFKLIDISFKNAYKKRKFILSLLSFFAYLIIIILYSIFNPLKDNLILYIISGLAMIIIYNIYIFRKVGEELC